MDEVMNQILSRVLSQEIANQENWAQDDAERGLQTDRRTEIVTIIKDFMQENDIPFRADLYTETKRF